MMEPDATVTKMLAVFYTRAGKREAAVSLLERFAVDHGEKVDQELVFTLCELYIQAGHYEPAVEMVMMAQQRLCGPEGLPLELQVL